MKHVTRTASLNAFLVTILAFLIAAPLVLADEDRPDHFEGEPAETLEQAVANLSEYNARLKAIISKDDLSDADHAEIHELTYTLENALGKMREELDVMAENLEAVHLASEDRDSDVIREKAPTYLSVSQKLVE